MWCSNLTVATLLQTYSPGNSPNDLSIFSLDTTLSNPQDLSMYSLGSEATLSLTLNNSTADVSQPYELTLSSNTDTNVVGLNLSRFQDSVRRLAKNYTSILSEVLNLWVFDFFLFGVEALTAVIIVVTCACCCCVTST